MSQFEFETKEQREAWRVLRDNKRVQSHWIETRPALDQAAARFDAREKTCGIEPLSEEHFLLGSFECTMNLDMIRSMSRSDNLNSLGLLRVCKTETGLRVTLSDKGRTVLANLNAMCKVQA